MNITDKQLAFKIIKCIGSTGRDAPKISMMTEIPLVDVNRVARALQLAGVLSHKSDASKYWAAVKNKIEFKTEEVGS